MNTEMENGTQMTLEECVPMISQKQTVGASDSHVLPKELIFLQKKDISQLKMYLSEIKSLRTKEDGVATSVPVSMTRNIVEEEIENTLDTSCNQGIFVQVSEELVVYAVWYERYQCYIAIRRLTPKECFRLQGWTDDYFEKAQFVNSDSQLYKQAGNGVTVNVIEAIAEKLRFA